MSLRRCVSEPRLTLIAAPSSSRPWSTDPTNPPDLDSTSTAAPETPDDSVLRTSDDEFLTPAENTQEVTRPRSERTNSTDSIGRMIHESLYGGTQSRGIPIPENLQLSNLALESTTSEESQLQRTLLSPGETREGSPRRRRESQLEPPSSQDESDGRQSRHGRRSYRKHLEEDILDNVPHAHNRSLWKESVKAIKNLLTTRKTQLRKFCNALERRLEQECDLEALLRYFNEFETTRDALIDCWNELLFRLSERGEFPDEKKKLGEAINEMQTYLAKLLRKLLPTEAIVNGNASWNQRDIEACITENLRIYYEPKVSTLLPHRIPLRRTPDNSEPRRSEVERTTTVTIDNVGPDLDADRQVPERRTEPEGPPAVLTNKWEDLLDDAKALYERGARYAYSDDVRPEITRVLEAECRNLITDLCDVGNRL